MPRFWFLIAADLVKLSLTISARGIRVRRLMGRVGIRVGIKVGIRLAIEKIVRQLKDANLIRRVGGKKFGRWEVG